MEIEINSALLKSIEEKCLACIESGDPDDAKQFEAATGFKPATFAVELGKEPQLLASRIERYLTAQRTDTSKLRDDLSAVIAGHSWSDLVVQDGIAQLQHLSQEMMDYPDIQNDARSFTRDNVNTAIFALTTMSKGRPISHHATGEAPILLSIADTVRANRIHARDHEAGFYDLGWMLKHQAFVETSNSLNSAPPHSPNPDGVLEYSQLPKWTPSIPHEMDDPSP